MSKEKYFLYIRATEYPCDLIKGKVYKGVYSERDNNETMVKLNINGIITYFYKFRFKELSDIMGELLYE